jgi:hypothetical protein
MNKIEYCPWCGKPTSKKTKIVAVVEEDSILPHAWTAWTEHEEELYIKHRWGVISFYSMLDRKHVYDVTISDDSMVNRLFSYDDLKRYTNSVFEWPEKCEGEENDHETRYNQRSFNF